MFACSACLSPGSEYVCSCCHTRYCSLQCQETDWIENEHALVCSEWPYKDDDDDDDDSLPIGDEEWDDELSTVDNDDDDDTGYASIGALALPTQPPALDNSYKKRRFYLASVALMKRLRKDDFFAWMCVQSYKTSPIINAILFKVNGNFTKFDETFMGVGAEKARAAAALKREKDPYSIFGTFFATALAQAVEIGRPLIGPRSGRPITTKKALMEQFPQMRRPLTMRSKAAFTRLYIQTLERLIYSIPRTPKRSEGKSVHGFRGYTPIGLANTLTLRPSEMRVGQEITNWGFMSVSLDYRVSTLFVGKKTNPGCCFLDVRIPSRFSALLISSDSSDRKFPADLTPWRQLEVLLPVGCVFRVVASTGENAWPLSTNEPGQIIYTPIAYLKLVRIAKKRTK